MDSKSAADLAAQIPVLIFLHHTYSTIHYSRMHISVLLLNESVLVYMYQINSKTTKSDRPADAVHFLKRDTLAISILLKCVFDTQ